jgi:SAM-dependent methyltransferase
MSGMLSDLLGRVRALKRASSLSEMRQAIAELKTQLEAEQPVPGTHFVVDRLGQVAAAHTPERARYYLERLERSLTKVRSDGISDINLNRWQEYTDIITDSLWLFERRDSSGVHCADYWGNFVPQIPYQMMRRYTQPGEWVLDTFAGAGTTLIEGRRLGRNTIGIELQPEVAERARSLIALEPCPGGPTLAEMVTADSCTVDLHALLAGYGRRSVQLVIMHPPYLDIIKFSDDPRDLSNSGSVEAYLERMRRLTANVSQVLDEGRYLVLVIGDKYAAGEWIPLGFRTMDVVMQMGFSLKSIIVKNFEGTTAKRTQKALWRYRALAGGFYVFKHEYVFIFRRRIGG